jgi:[ribosomal protein S5]-alanine N-acetyltransferase
MNVTTPDVETTLETERLILEPLRVAHAAEMFTLLQDARIFTFIPHDSPRHIGEVEARLARLETRRSPDGGEQWLNWIVRTKSDRACVGRVEATLRRSGAAHIAYEIAPDRWGLGYGTEACARMIRALFDDFGVSIIKAEIDTRNAASIRLVERLGFRRAGVRERADYFKSMPSDEVDYVLERDTPQPP